MSEDRPLHILFVEDVASDATLAARELNKNGLVFTFARVDTALALSDALLLRTPDLVISDFSMPDFTGLDALALTVAHDPGLPFIFLTGALDEETAVRCLKAGAWDYVLKERMARLPYAVRDALSRHQANVEAARVRAELIDSDRRYCTLANSGRALVWTSAGSRTCNFVNQPWLDYTGRVVEQESGEGWLESLHPDDRDRCLAARAAAYSSRAPFTVVYRLCRHDGEYRSFQEDGSVRLDATGHSIGLIGHCFDVTDRLRAEEDRGRFQAALAQAQKMEAVGRLAGGVSHDFNNLLTGILGYSDLLLTSMPASSPHRADISQIQAVAQRASTLTRQLLAFSRKQPMSPVPLNLSTLMGDLRKPVRTMLRESIDVAWELGSDLGEVAGDPGQIEQAVYNLISNAGDAMPDGGRLTIRTLHVSLDQEFATAHPGSRSGSHVALSVIDTGSGIEPHLLPLLFEPFFTTKAPGQGTGLGLAAVYGIVKQCGGYVCAESVVQRGSTFTMYFPLTGGLAAAEAEPAVQPVPGTASRETILVVEDDEGLRILLRRALESYGYAILDAADGVQAAARWLGDAARIDLLLSDVVLPGHSGIEVARQFRASNPALLVVFVSGYTDPTIFNDLVLDASTAFVRKPYLPSMLERQIRQMLDRRTRAPGFRP